MKAALIASLFVSASAVANCGIPAAYATTTGAACSGPVTGYNLWGFCQTGLNPAIFTIAAGVEARVALSTTNGGIFTSNVATDTQGCAIPSWNGDWGMGGTTTTPLTATVACAPANAATGADSANAAFNVANSALKGLEIKCDLANQYYPVNGHEGSMLCADGTNGLTVNAGAQFVFPINAATPTYWTSGFGHALDGTALQNFNAAVPLFSGTGALQCASACTINANICTGGNFLPGIAWAGEGYLGNCRMRPNYAAWWPSSLTFFCRTGQQQSPQFTGACTATAAAATFPSATTTSAFTSAYAGQCGTTEGAQSTPLWNYDDKLDNFPLTVGGTLTQAAGLIQPNFPAANSVLTNIYAVAAGAYATNWRRREWNNNPVQPFQAGFVYDIAVKGCETQVGLARTQCVQHTLNYWRCTENFPFTGGALCYANNAPIACPTHELGFRCPSSSKKGLLGLLGLLGLIPLLLLCCCLFFLCCIRRKKTEADVHFATFDPLGAPQATAACPTAFAATPFACAPSAVPIL